MITSTKAFQAGLNLWVDEVGWGGQARIADLSGTDRSYFNKITAGSQPGSDEVRERIAFVLGYNSSDELVALGRRVLAGETIGQDEYVDIARRAKQVRTGQPATAAAHAADTQEWKYAHEVADNQHGPPRSRDRAFYIWEDLGCTREMAFPGSFDSTILQHQIQDYMDGKLTDAQLFDEACQWCRDLIDATVEFHKQRLLKRNKQ